MDHREKLIQFLFYGRQEEHDERFHEKPHNHWQPGAVVPGFPGRGVAGRAIQSEKYDTSVWQDPVAVLLQGEEEW